MRRGATLSGLIAALITAIFFGIEVWVNKARDGHRSTAGGTALSPRCHREDLRMAAHGA
jgi:hypothetical protein